MRRSTRGRDQHRDLEQHLQRGAVPVDGRPQHADDRDAAGPLSLCRHSLVLDHVRPRRPDHRAADAVDRSARRARRAAAARRLSGQSRSIRWPTPSPARSCTRCAAARWRRCARCRSRNITAASIRRRCSCCSPASMSSAPATRRRCANCGRRSRRRWRWIDGPGDPDGDGFVEYQRASEQGLANQGWKDSYDAIFHADGRLAEGYIALARSAGLRLRRQAAGGALRAAARHCRRRRGSSKTRPTQLAERFEEAFWCEELGTYALALDGDKQPCKVRTSNAGQLLFTGIVARGSRPHGRRRPDAAAFLHRLGHPHRRARRGALQSDVLSRRLDLAARQRADRARARALRPQAFGRASVQGAVRRRDLHGSAAAARTVLRLPARAAARADALSGRLRAAGLGERDAVHAAGGRARPRIRRARAAKSGCAIRVCRRSSTR